MSDSLRLHGLYSPWNSPGHNTGVGSSSLRQGIFPTQGLNPGLPHCRRILYQLSHKGSPRILELVAISFSRGSSWPRNKTGVSWIAGRLLTNWAIREAQPSDWMRPGNKYISNPYDTTATLISHYFPVKVKGTQLCPTLLHPKAYTVHGILQAIILEWVAIVFSRGSSQLRDQTQDPCIAFRFFTIWATREASEITLNQNGLTSPIK